MQIFTKALSYIRESFLADSVNHRTVGVEGPQIAYIDTPVDPLSDIKFRIRITKEGFEGVEVYGIGYNETDELLLARYDRALVLKLMDIEFSKLYRDIKDIDFENKRKAKED